MLMDDTTLSPIPIYRTATCISSGNVRPWTRLRAQMVGIWCVTVWQQLGRPPALRLVELGPGRGTLMADLLRGTAPFEPFASALQVRCRSRL